MGTLPTLKPRAVVGRLESLGLIEVRQRGSHKQFRHTPPAYARAVTFGASDVARGFLRLLLQECVDGS